MVWVFDDSDEVVGVEVWVDDEANRPERRRRLSGGVTEGKE